MDILREDMQLMTYYIAKNSNFMIQLHKRVKKAETEERAFSLLQLYCAAYPVNKYC